MASPMINDKVMAAFFMTAGSFMLGKTITLDVYVAEQPVIAMAAATLMVASGLGMYFLKK